MTTQESGAKQRHQSLGAVHLRLPGREGAPVRVHEDRAGLLREALPLLRRLGQAADLAPAEEGTGRTSRWRRQRITQLTQPRFDSGHCASLPFFSPFLGNGGQGDLCRVQHSLCTN